MLVPHNTAMCDRQNTTEVEELQPHTGTGEPDESSHRGDLKEKRGGIRFIADWMRSKDKEEERREKWCHVVSVLDRYILIALTVILIVFGVSLSKGQRQSDPNHKSEENYHH